MDNIFLLIRSCLKELGMTIKDFIHHNLKDFLYKLNGYLSKPLFPEDFLSRITEANLLTICFGR